MGDLLTDHQLKKERPGPDNAVALLARAQTLTVLGRLDARRKGELLLFVYGAGLISPDLPKAMRFWPCSAPTLGVPALDAPDLSKPTLAMPTLAVPSSSMPTSAVPTLELPTLQRPTLAVPTLAMPGFTVPILATPTLQRPKDGPSGSGSWLSPSEALLCQTDSRPANGFKTKRAAAAI
jgi:hypothetical protein